jgi:hypothetical protein
VDPTCRWPRERGRKGRGLTHGPGLAASEKEERGGAGGPAEERRAGLLGRARRAGPREAGLLG